MLSADSFKGAMIGALVTGVILAPGGAIAGYFIEREIDKDAVMEELNRRLKRKRNASSPYFERNHIALRMAMDKLSNHHAETDYTLRLVDLRF